MQAGNTKMPAHQDDPIAKNAFIGPVCDVEHTPEFTTVLVPHPLHHEDLVWINVWCSHGKRKSSKPVNFARILR